jgi:hypothetical protein
MKIYWLAYKFHIQKISGLFSIAATTTNNKTGKAYF